jgi:hypothetical protein
MLYFFLSMSVLNPFIIQVSDSTNIQLEFTEDNRIIETEIKRLEKLKRDLVKYNTSINI